MRGPPATAQPAPAPRPGERGPHGRIAWPFQRKFARTDLEDLPHAYHQPDECSVVVTAGLGSGSIHLPVSSSSAAPVHQIRGYGGKYVDDNGNSSALRAGSLENRYALSRNSTPTAASAALMSAGRSSSS